MRTQLRHLTLALIGASSLCACATLEHFTSGQVGCPPNEITILDEEVTLGARTWIAQCLGERYTCSGHGGSGHLEDVACAPFVVEPSGGSSGAVGCQHDGQCKGDRICEASECVSPEGPAESAGCENDAQCKGDRVCEDGACVSPEAPKP